MATCCAIWGVSPSNGRITILLVGESISIAGKEKLEQRRGPTRLSGFAALVIPHTLVRTALFHGQDGFPIRIIERLVELEFRVHGPPLAGGIAVERLEKLVYFL